MIKGFKEFIMRGNVIDLAVAVVIGAAFAAIVTAIVDGLINPLIAMLFNAESLAKVTTTINDTVFEWGAVVAAVINFLAVALIVYLVFVMPMNKFNERRAAKAGVEEEEAAPTEQELLVQIRDLLEKRPV
ncbi:large conductance mechanosensitive channel protein MscL [Microbacterium sp.]|uniref:large conductance mechanosensitive channel protein MscL n=1 Tax=Microbacterium sp. TaxID=51671 RepID=UPI003A83DBEE